MQSLKPKLIIYLTIVAIGFLILALFLTGCSIGYTNTFSDIGPAWSPDGAKIAFLSVGAEDKFDIWVMNEDGSNKINLTGN